MHLPSCEDEGEDIVHLLSPMIQVEYESIGRWFEACLKRQHSSHSISVAAEDIDDINGEIAPEELTEDEKLFMIGLDEAVCKWQDHYRVLSIEDKRGCASDMDIKNAYRKKVLMYHPDKKKSDAPVIPGLNIQQYFTCIQRAYETMSTVEGRRAFDSVDTTHDDLIPTFSSSTKDKDFFEVFSDVFKSNSRWSELTPVPQLGDIDTSIDDVNEFYNFWYNDFRSWREFSMRDKEDLDQAECREEKRWMEQQNRKARQTAKKEEIQRIRKLVDNAFQNDPRLKKFQEDQKKKKQEEKRLKEEVAKKKEEERQARLKEEREQKEKLEQEAKEKAVIEKKEKEKLKKSVARDKKYIRQFVKDCNYFNTEQVEGIDVLEKTMSNLSLENIQQLREKSSKENIEQFEALYRKCSKDIIEDLQSKLDQKEKEKLIAASQFQSAKASSSTGLTDQNWNDLELQLLVKASQLFPVGTVQRWEVMANYINDHADSDKIKTGRHVITKVKKLQELNPSVREEVNKKAFQSLSDKTSAKLSNAPITDESEITHKEMNGTAKSAPAAPETPTTAAPEAAPAKPAAKVEWSTAEQQLLEEALKKIGSSVPERWERIAEHVKTRTKKECMKRYKELVEMVKAAAAAPETSNIAAPEAAPAKPAAKVEWSTAEQQLLEEALKKIGSSVPERWERIAEHVKTRTKKECMKRYKELVEMVKARKTAAK